MLEEWVVCICEYWDMWEDIRVYVGVLAYGGVRCSLNPVFLHYVSQGCVTMHQH